jgi:hypothetical protein
MYWIDLAQNRDHWRALVCRILVAKSEGKGPLETSRRRCVDNIRMDLRETEWSRMDWIDLAQDRGQWRALVNTILNLRFP